MTCRELVDFLDDYLANELPSAERVCFEAHLGECPDCVAYVRGYREAVRLGKASFAGGDGPVPADVPEELVQAILGARGRKR